ncbi:MAG TPA: efflux RND transporter periplasmic adaptor subunit [Rudaea sp.]|jgi:membrane fusion protein (multidrug efflux system)|nr:efflux RND transporter periplasmic adaptor subunit [Rudaea sp.]
MKTPRNSQLNSLICVAIISAAAALSGCGNGGGAQAKEAEKSNVNAVPVEVATVAKNAVNASYNGTATLVADHEAQVASKATGVLMKVLVEEGMTVHEGQLLAELDNSSATASVAQAEAQMNKADATFTYAEQSIKKQLISKREYDQANFDMQTQKAALQTARLQLAYTRIVAPVSGVIAERSVKVGNLIQVNQNLFRIVGMDPLQAVLNVPERQLGILKAGQAVQLEADALPGKKFTGDILRIAPTVDAASGTFRVTCQFRDKTATLKPGMFGRIDIVYDHRDEAVTIPRSALIEEDGETAVFVVDAAPVKVPTADSKAKDADKSKTPAKDSKDTKAIVASTPGFVAHRKLVQIGYSDGDKVEIRSGVDIGARVITVGRNAVRDGTAVQVLDTTLVAAKAGGDKA